MREIEFRGWHTVRKKMFYSLEMAEDQLTILPTGQFINVSGDSTKQSVIYPIDKFIPLQYTGLKDATSRKIFEGDIIQWHKSRDVVARTDGGWNPFIDDMQTDGAWHYEIIGNIYENPEMIPSSNS